MGMIQEFKDFAMKGNVVDLAVGVIMGGAFGKIVSSLVGDVLMPVIGLVTGGVNFKENSVRLKEAVMDGDKVVAPALDLNWGIFAQNVFDFLIVAFCIFMMVKAMNSMKKKQDAAPAEPPVQEKLLGEIRDLLKTR